jgi:hypothetical protein
VEDIITYVWLMVVAIAIGMPALQFPFVILGFRFFGSLAHANTEAQYAKLRERCALRVLCRAQNTRQCTSLCAMEVGTYGAATTCPEKDVLDGGGGLFLLITPTGQRYWRLKYRFAERKAVGAWRVPRGYLSPTIDTSCKQHSRRCRTVGLLRRMCRRPVLSPLFAMKEPDGRPVVDGITPSPWGHRRRAISR